MKKLFPKSKKFWKKPQAATTQLEEQRSSQSLSTPTSDPVPLQPEPSPIQDRRLHTDVGPSHGSDDDEIKHLSPGSEPKSQTHDNSTKGSQVQ